MAKKEKPKEEAVIPSSPSEMSTVIDINNKVREDKASRALTFLSAVVQVTNEEEDQYANDVLVKTRERIQELEKLRKQYSTPINEWLSLQIEPEKKLQAEYDRIKKYRDEYADKIAQEERAKKLEIEKKRIFDQHEAEVKGRMKESVEISVAKRLSDLEKSVSEAINGMSLDTADEANKKLLSFKPALKKEFFDKLFVVRYDSAIMTAEEFNNLQMRAMGYWKYEDINDAYIEKANEIIKKWFDQIPFRVKELKDIAAGNAAAKAAADKRMQEDEQERQRLAAQEQQRISNEAQAEVQDAQLRADFNAQLNEQAIETSNAATRRKYRIDSTKDSNLMEVSAIVAKAIIHLIGEKSHKSIYKTDRDGKIKTDEDGDVVYVDGVQYWLDQLSKFNYPVNIPGLVCTEYKSTSARKAR